MFRDRWACLRGHLSFGLITVLAFEPAPASSAESPDARAEEGLLRLERAADATCPKTALRIHKVGIQARQAFQSGIPDAIKAMTDAMLALAEICKLEQEQCGVGPARIGMTMDEAIRTSWCFPDKKNRTEIAGHVREQWIYGGRGYLYFDNGRLTGIQERR